jgi:hypothetical protein
MGDEQNVPGVAPIEIVLGHPNREHEPPYFMEKLGRMFSIGLICLKGWLIIIYGITGEDSHIWECV